MKYVIVDTVDWSDEHEVPIFEVLDERDKAIYDLAKETFGSWIDSYQSGSYIIEDFDYLDWDPVEITDEEYKVVLKVMPRGAEVYRQWCISMLRMSTKSWEWLVTATLDEIREEFINIKKLINENSGNE